MTQGGQDESIRPFPQPLVNTKVDVFTLPVEHAAHIRALVVADQRFGKTLPITRSLPQCLKNMMTIVVRESINCIFMLGDIVHAASDRGLLSAVVRALEQLPIPVYIMGGPETRVLLFDYKYEKPGSNVHIVYNYAIRIPHPAPLSGAPPNVFLAYDLCNPFAVGPSDAQSYVVALKRGFDRDIRSEDFLLVGRPNHYVFNDELRCASIKDFSPDNHHSGYAVIVVEKDGFKIQIVGK